MQWYYSFLVRRPYLMIIAIAVFCLACIIVSLTTAAVPDFTDPTLGFEARGTEFGKRLTAWHNLIEETGPSGALHADPNELLIEPDQFEDRPRKRKRKRKNKQKNKVKKQKNKNKSNSAAADELHGTLIDMDQPTVNQRLPAEWNGDNGIYHEFEFTNDTWPLLEQLNRSEHFEYGRNMTFIDEDDHQEKIQIKKSTWRILKQAKLPPSDIHLQEIDGYFCASPVKQYTHFVVERIGPNATDSLFDLNGMLAMCQLQEQITAVHNYEEYCEKEMLIDNCCRTWSLPNYAALLANKSSCFDLTVTDVELLQNLLIGCFDYFHDLKISNDCSESNRCFAPPECKRHNVVFNVLHFLTDRNFINDSHAFLKYAMIFAPVPHTTKILPLFHEWENADLKNEIVQVVAMDMGLENELFNELLLSDAWLVALGGIFVTTCMWLYTNSLFVTSMTCLAVFFSLGLAYFVYTLVFEMTFFPYMNLLAVIVMIGIGADDAFIFVKIWQCVLSERFSKNGVPSTVTETQSSTVDVEYTETLQNLMALTLRHASVSMFVTSLTTAVAFYASYTSSITAIKCFSVFAGTAVITNYLLMVSWLPASVSIMERLSACNTCSKVRVQQLMLMFNKSIMKFCNLFETMICGAVMKYAVVWVTSFGILGLSSAIIVLYSPGIQLPENAHFQLFVSRHPFEVYSKLKNEFWFEKSMAAFENFKLPLRFVWGIQPIDDGDYSNPYSHGNLYYDNNFNISTKAAQIWLYEFCQHLRQQPFYELTFGMLLPNNCFIEHFKNSMKRMCIDSMADTNRTPCCDVSKFPYEPHIFELCLPDFTTSLFSTSRQYFIPGVAGPKFSAAAIDTSSDELEVGTADNGTYQQLSAPPPLVKALVIEFESNVSYTTVYQDVKSFVQAVEEFFAAELKNAPQELQGGWFVSELKFFDVQDTLSRGTLVAITVAMCSSLVVLLLVTLNVLISLYAVITVSFTILTTVAILILLGWRLNVLESVTVCTAIGLAVDFSLHYSIHFRLSPSCERTAATQFALTRIIGPTSMAALTTGLAGALMLASNVLPYIQIGIFLVIVMSISWLYATFFLMGLLKMAGPQYGFMQFNYPQFGKRRRRPLVNGTKYYERKPSQIVASEHLLTPCSSAVGDLIISETHELESLASNSLIKTISGTECPNILPVDFARAPPQNIKSSN